jgi:transposase-like protein
LPASQQDKRPQARAMFAEGKTCEQIAGILGVHAATVYRWKQAAEKACSPWGEARETYQIHDLRGVVAQIHKRLTLIAGDEEMGAAAWADALQKTVNSLAAIEEKYGNITSKLRCCMEIAEFCQTAAGVSDDDLHTMRRVLDAYLDHLRRSNA